MYLLRSEVYQSDSYTRPNSRRQRWFHWVTSGTKTCPNPTHWHSHIYQFFFKIQMFEANGVTIQWHPLLFFSSLSWTHGFDHGIMLLTPTPHPERSVIYITYISWVLHVGLWVFVLNLFLINCLNFKFIFRKNKFIREIIYFHLFCCK